jgi:hypothetical protein
MPIMRPAAAPGIKATKIDFGAILGLLRKALDAGKVPQSKPHAAAFTDYLIAHDSRPRRQIAILARQRRECGFGK